MDKEVDKILKETLKNQNIQFQELEPKMEKVIKEQKEVKKKVKELRKQAGYNREEVAGLLNISVATLRKYEDGKSLVRLDILVSMLQIYGCELNKFLNQINFNLLVYA